MALLPIGWETTPRRPDIEAPSLIHARLLAGVRGVDVRAEFTKGYQLDSTMAGLVPEKLIGVMISPSEAEQLLQRLAPP